MIHTYKKLCMDRIFVKYINDDCFGGRHKTMLFSSREESDPVPQMR